VGGSQPAEPMSRCALYRPAYQDASATSSAEWLSPADLQLRLLQPADDDLHHLGIMVLHQVDLLPGVQHQHGGERESILRNDSHAGVDTSRPFPQKLVLPSSRPSKKSCSSRR
ncbi:hypothetical protein, partial [Enterobacter hormaechei]|uniref:hypothetical protein n=1 Tax=Enterobacter hormaechei TaxID=158836 RepID=UPI002E19B9D3|nr:hypothetical protein [Enterobacter hormaechei]